MIAKVLERTFLVAAIGSLAACSGPIETRFGAVGSAPGGAGSVAILQVPHDGDGGTAGASQAEAQAAVVAALGRNGITTVAEAADYIEIAITARPASSGISVIGGADLSTAKKQKLLQSCHDTTYRLALVYYSGADAAATSRSWAEESHCHGQLSQSLPALANQAVAALVQGRTGTSQRSGVD
ncbi:hypothetical protein [Novosphingobium lentum]|uniref:hypothetical protein n=1 Tax=Novosphingobium lentum TaxID=145287 RepID=UPI0008301E7B|nr:hypothetical protein [Novosphingobium lentum]